MVGASFGGPAKKTLELEVKIRGDSSQASKAMQGLAADAEKVAAGLGKAAQAAGTLNQQMGGRSAPPGAGAVGMLPPGPLGYAPGMQPPRPLGPPSVMPGVGPSLGGSRLIGFTPPPPPGPAHQEPWVKRLASSAELLNQVGQFAIVAEAASALHGLADACATLTISGGTARDKLDKLGEEVPVIGHLATALPRAIFAVADQFDPHNIRMRNPQYALDYLVTRRVENQMYASRLEAQTRSEAMAREEMLRVDRINSMTRTHLPEFGASALLGFGIPGGPATLDPRQVAAENATVAARREADVERRQAERVLLASGRSQSRAQEQFYAPGGGARLGELSVGAEAEELKQRYAISRTSTGLMKGFSDPTGLHGTDRESLKRSLASFNERLVNSAADLANYEKAISEYRDKAVSSAQRDYQLAQARTGELRAQVAILRDKEEQSRSGAVGYASSSLDQRAELLLAARRFKQSGFDSLPAEWKQLLLGNSITGPQTALEAERSGNADPGFQQLLKDFGLRDSTTIRAERLKAEMEIRVKGEIDEKKLYEALDKAFGEFDKRTDQLIKWRLQQDEAEKTRRQIAGQVGAS